MGIFEVFKIVLKVPNRAQYHILFTENNTITPKFSIFSQKPQFLMVKHLTVLQYGISKNKIYSVTIAKNEEI